MRDNFFTSGTIHQKPWIVPARPKVTIAIGIISKHRRFPEDKGQIVFASDSQTTYPGGQKRLDAQKINVVNFANAQIMVAQSGSAELADAAIDILQRKAEAITVESTDTISQAVKSAVLEVRNHLKEINQGCGFTDDSWKKFFMGDNAFNLLWGYFFKGNPYLYSINIDWCFPVPVKNNFKAIGCGAPLGEYLLREYGDASPDFEFSDVIATAVIEKVIENVEGCGRPSWVGIVRHVGDSTAASDFDSYKKGDIIPAEKTCEAFICRRQLTDAISVELARHDKKTKSKDGKRLLSVIYSICKKFGAMVYTEPHDNPGGGAFRMSAYFKSKEEEEKGLKKLMVRDRPKPQQK